MKDCFFDEAHKWSVFYSSYFCCCYDFWFWRGSGFMFYSVKLNADLISQALDILWEIEQKLGDKIDMFLYRKYGAARKLAWEIPF